MIPKHYAKSLSNIDILPVPDHKKNWGTWGFIALWIGLSIQTPSYMMASSLIASGMSALQALFVIFLANTIVLIPILLNSHAGTKYGIPFPVYARASFGILGARIPAILRAIVGCGWFGIQTWIGGQAIYTLLKIFFPDAEILNLRVTFLDVPIVSFACFMLFWFMNIFFIWKGMSWIKYLEILSSPFLIFFGLCLLYWAVQKASGFGPLFENPSKFTSWPDFMKIFIPSLTAIIGFWATLSLNISDFTRFSSSQKNQILGQTFGLPLSMTFFAFIGVVVTSATIIIYNEAIWDPIILIQKFNHGYLIFAIIAIVFATLTTNVAANVVGPANDFSNLLPQYIDFKLGGLITGIIGILIQPWQLIADPTGYIFVWLIGYSALLGPIAGILIVDYYFIRKTNLYVQDLYRNKGKYIYNKGYNIKAFIALALGIAPNIPGFLHQIKLVNLSYLPCLTCLYDYAWFVGFGVSSILYAIFMRKNKYK